MIWPRRVTLAAAALASALLLLPAAAGARRQGAGEDGRPNILVVMTDDQAATDVAKMPNVRRLLVKKGATFTDAVDSFPLCCPSRATFITGQYAHNHGVVGNFYPYGWYGMEERGNTLPRWLQQSGYRTALIGKWLNGYGARDAHGEVPVGFDIWRGLLDVSAYDYFNFVMNRDGKLKTWGDAKFAKGLVKFAKVEVTPNPEGLQGVFDALRKQFGPAPYDYWGTHRTRDYSPDVTGKATENLVKAEKDSEDPFFIWWAPAAPHREDVATTLMGRPGPDPRPAPRYKQTSKSFRLPRPPSFNEADISDKASNLTDHASVLTDDQLEQLQLDYEGRIGSLRAVDDHVKRLVDILERTGQLDNTLILFLSDNGWLQGQHRIPGDKFLPFEESLRVPFIMRGPGVPEGKTIRAHVTNIDFAPTLVDVAGARAGRKLDGVSLTRVLRNPGRAPNRIVEIEAPRPLFEQNVPVNAWDRPYKGVRTGRYTYVVYTESGDEELYDRRTDPHQLRSLAADPAYAQVRARLAAKLAKLDSCAGAACNIAP
ncbi:MAG TPA: sulfatase [Thermoleophilaceae bacterium]|nr:sulfatase [Thermoleophilaceae bacterium]